MATALDHIRELWRPYGVGPGYAGRQLRLDTLVKLRWLAVVGQVAAVMIVRYSLGFPLPLLTCLALIGLSAALNVGLRLTNPPSLRLGSLPAVLLLGYDLLQLAGLLYLTGGLENPFAILILVPVIVSATTLAPGPTILLGVLTLALVTGLAFQHRPLPWMPGATFDVPFTFVAGVWVALASALVFTGVYAFRVADEARKLARALNAAELALAREHRISALDGLAAAAAHELGTPLATIALVAREMAREVPADSPIAEDIALIGSQSQRCRDILARLTSAKTDDHFDRPKLSHLIAAVAEPHRELGIAVAISTSSDGAAEPEVPRNPAILYGLGNLIENAVDFAETAVEITASWSPDEVAITIADDGPGFSPDIIDRIGEPYVTSRPAGGPEPTEEAGGLGLGIFIAKTLLERTGARLTIGNRPAAEPGAIIHISWPRTAFVWDNAENPGEALFTAGAA